MWDRLVLTAIVALAALACLVLATGHLSALVRHGGWPRYQPRDIPGVLARVVAAPEDPGRAWDLVNRGAAPPGPIGWWATFAVLATVAGAPVVLALTKSRRRRAPGATWGKHRQLRRLGAKRQSGRLNLGRVDHRLLAVEARHSLLVLGPTQSGKTTGLALPAILEWAGPVVATSTKGDLIEHSIGWRSHRGEVHVFDPSAATRYHPSGWTPLARCDSWPGANQAAWELAMAGKAAAGTGVNLAELWYSGAAKVLAPYLHAAACSGRTIADVARWIDAEERDEVARLLQRRHSDATLALNALFKREDRSRSSLFQVMQQILSVYLEPTVARSAERHDIVPGDLLDGENTLYVIAPHKKQDRFRPLFATLIGQVLDAAYQRHASTGRPLDPPLLLVLDEAANIAPIDDLPTVASTAAAVGIQVVTIFQDIAQVEARYGNGAGTIVNNHRAKLWLPGISDLDTLELPSRLAGEEEIERPSVTTDATGRRSNTSGTHWRRLLPADLVRQLGDGEGILLYGNLPPVRLRLRPWFASRRLRRRAEHPQRELPPCPLPPAPDAMNAPTEAPPPPASVGPTGGAGSISVLEAARARRVQRREGEQP